MFAASLGIIEAIVRLGERATIGEIQKMNMTMTRGQVERILKNLHTEHYVEFKRVPYGRTGKMIWSISDRGFTNICIVARAVWDHCNDEEVA